MITFIRQGDLSFKVVDHVRESDVWVKEFGSAMRLCVYVCVCEYVIFHQQCAIGSRQAVTRVINKVR